MIVTAQPFFNEIDLLMVKCHELAGEVDAHVIVESPLTFTGLSKPLYFQQNAERFKDFNIIRAVCELPEVAESAWHREAFQYDAVRAIVRGLNPEIVLWVDADEIPRSGTVRRFQWAGFKAMSLGMDKLMFSFDRFEPDAEWNNGKIGYYDPDCPPLWRGTSDLPVLKDAGWHCEYFGDREHLLAKLAATSHADESQSGKMQGRVAAGELPGIERTSPYPKKKLPRFVLNR